MIDTKETNPKDAVGMKKAPLSLVPWTLIVCAARGLLEGALKYGRFNYRAVGIRASIYLDALKRHIAKWENGQDCDPKTLVHHLDSAIGCLAIMRDAMLYGKMTDDRPPCPDPDAMARMIDGDEAIVAHLKELFKDESPYQYTIADTRVFETAPSDIRCQCGTYLFFGHFAGRRSFDFMGVRHTPAGCNELP